VPVHGQAGAMVDVDATVGTWEEWEWFA
jgi:hypothetical protein